MAAGKPKDNPPRDVDWRTLHLWQIQPVRDLLVLAGAFGLIWLGYMLSPVTVPILLALALAYLFEPLVQRVTRRGWISRQGAALAIIVGIGVVVVVPVSLGLGFAVLQGVRLVAKIGDNTGKLIESVQGATEADRKAAFDKLPKGWEPISEGLNELRLQVERERRRRAEAAIAPPPADEQAKPAADEPEVATEMDVAIYEGLDIIIKWVRNNAQTVAKEVGQRVIGGGAQALSAVIGFFGSVAVLAFTGCLTAFFFYFFSTGYGRVLAFWESLIPERKRGRVFDLLNQMDRVIAGFIRGRITICAILAVYMTLAYWLIGVPAPLILGPAVGLLFIVPFVHGLGIPIAMLLMWLEPAAGGWQREWWWILLAPVGVYVIAQLLDDYVLTPRIQGKATGMDAPAILFASIAGGVLAGVYGLLLAIPVAACIKILLHEVFWPRFKAWSEGKEEDLLPVGRE